MDGTPITALALSPKIRAELGSVRTKLFYGFGSVAFGVKDNGFQYFLLFFYSQVLGVPALSVGLAIFIALGVDALADPIVGQISDNLRTRLGRRHPLMYAAAIPAAIAYYFVWNPPALPPNLMFFYLIGIAIVSRTFITMYEIPSSALVAELTPDYDQRTAFLSFRYFFGWIGGIAVNLLAFAVFFAATRQYPFGQLNPAGYTKYAIVSCVLIVIAIVVSAAGTQKFVPYFAVPPKRRITLGQTLREMRETLRNRSFLVLLVSAIFSAVAAGTLTALNNHFNTFFWGLSAAQISWFTTAVIIAPFVALAITTPIGARLGKKRTAIILWIASTATYWLPMAARLLGVFPPNSSPWMLPLLVSLQTTGATLGIVCAITISSMLADVVEDSARITGRRSEGLFFAANAFVQKAVSGAGPLVAGILLTTLVHFPEHANPATLDPAIPRHLALVYFPVTFVLYAVALICLSFYRIDRATHEENVRKLAEEGLRAPIAIIDGPHTPEHDDPAASVAP
ncbi:MAG: MFS transporter [Alphaproteobacteria bacterium]|nr:MFS transporter [Alphaproteobacteria bacterium]MBL7096386.1 MFS transporter [Alphaproteobacteria bacterium]